MQLFIHSWRQVAGNLEQAIRIGMLLLIISVVSPLAPMLGLGAGFQLALALASLVVSISTAIAWHRYVLLGDAANADPLKPPQGSFLPYLLTGLRVALLLVFAVLVFSILASLIANMVFGAGFMVERPDGSIAAGPAFLPIIGLVAVMGNALFLRFALCFPAIALGQRITLQQSWQKTTPMNGQIILTSAIMIAAVLLLQSLASLLQGPGIGLVILGILTAVPLWLVTMFGISVLTTLYGHLVEGRSLNA